MSFWTRNIIVPETQEVRSKLKMYNLFIAP
jgi:hypothetical protein